MLRRSAASWSGVVAPKAPRPAKSGEYHFIVVGGGAAGALIASRLAQENYKTLVLDSGADVTRGAPWTRWHREAPAGPILHRAAGRYIRRIPAFVGDQVIELEVPEVVGGAGVVLGSKCYVRGHRFDWEDGKRFPQRYEESGLQLYYKKLEIIEGLLMHRGNRGRFFISRGKAVSKSYKPVLEGFSAAHVGFVNDLNAASGFSGEGAGRTETLIDDMKRTACSSVNQYVGYAREFRRPLIIRGSNTVDRVEMSNGAATGVVVKLKDGSEELIPSQRGVIVAAGALGTPGVLRRSSAGLPEHIAAALKASSLWTVPCVSLRFKIDQEVSAAPLANPIVRVLAHLDWVRDARGWLGNSFDDMVCYLESSVSRKRRGPQAPPYPDVKVTVVPMLLDERGDILPEHGITYKIQLIRPTVRGHLDEATGAPRFDNTSPQYMEDEAALAEAVERIRHAAMKTAPHFVSGTAPELPSFRTYEGPHGGTCPLGVIVDKDTNKVDGVEGLWVSDGSVVPEPLVAESVPLAYALAEQTVDRAIRRAPPVK